MNSLLHDSAREASLHVLLVTANNFPEEDRRSLYAKIYPVLAAALEDDHEKAARREARLRGVSAPQGRGEAET